MSKVIVIDPGHGGTQDVQGSAANHAISASGVLEKTMTLDMAKRTRAALSTKSPTTRVILTRDQDVNVAGADRAGVAKTNRADLFLSIHFNGFDKKVRGVETFVRDSGNINLAADKVYAQRIQTAILGAVRKHHPTAPDRKVKLDSDVGFSMAVLSDVSLGNINDPSPCLACLAEIEFIDHPAVDKLLNGAGNAAVRDDIANAIADALLAQLGITSSGSGTPGVTPSSVVLRKARVQSNDGVLSIRNGPAGNAKKVGELQNGDQVEVFEDKGKWRRIDATASRWVHGDFLTAVA